MTQCFFYRDKLIARVPLQRIYFLPFNFVYSQCLYIPLQDQNNLFMVRIAQGLVHLGKGTLTLNPFHSDRSLMSPVAVAGILSVLIAMLDVKESYWLRKIFSFLHICWISTLFLSNLNINAHITIYIFL